VFVFVFVFGVCVCWCVGWEGVVCGWLCVRVCLCCLGVMEGVAWVVCGCLESTHTHCTQTQRARETDTWTHNTHTQTHTLTDLKDILDGAPGTEVAINAQPGPNVLELCFGLVYLIRCEGGGFGVWWW
jgi:hypothetical protein